MGKHQHKLHQQYISTVTGLEYPGGSTIAGLLDKGMGMVGSAVKLTKAGLDYKKVWDEKRDAGTVLHGLIECHFKGTQFDTSAYSKNMIDRAENSMIKFYDWEKQHKIEVIHSEYQMINDELKAGGTADLICKIDNEITLADYKSGGLYESAFIQVSGYHYMAEKSLGIEINKILLLQFPQDETSEFVPRYLTGGEHKVYLEIFKELSKVYWLRNELKKKGDL